MQDDYLIENIRAILDRCDDWREIKLTRFRNPDCHDSDTWELEYITDRSLEFPDEEDGSPYYIRAWGHTKDIKKNN